MKGTRELKWKKKKRKRQNKKNLKEIQWPKECLRRARATDTHAFHKHHSPHLRFICIHISSSSILLRYDDDGDELQGEMHNWWVRRKCRKFYRMMTAEWLKCDQKPLARNCSIIFIAQLHSCAPKQPNFHTQVIVVVIKIFTQFLFLHFLAHSIG